jgi:hypothetical protein
MSGPKGYLTFPDGTKVKVPKLKPWKPMKINVPPKPSKSKKTR